MTITDLVEKIYSLNNVQNDFWIDYLERIRNGIKVTWYPSSGFDLRPIQSSAYSWKTEIGRELQNTDLIYSDYSAWINNYDLFMNIYNKKRDGSLSDSDMPEWWYTHLETRYFGEFLPAKYLESIEPFKLFTEDTRRSLPVYVKGVDFMSTETYLEKMCKHQYDGFAIKLKNLFAKHITIIFLCLDDRIVEDLFEEHSIEVIGLFCGDSGTCGPQRKGSVIKNIKYVFNATNGKLISSRNS